MIFFQYPNAEEGKTKISCLIIFLFYFFRLFDQIHQALNLWLWGNKYSVQLFRRVMFIQKRFDIDLHLPTTDYPSAGKHVILETAEFKIDFAAHHGASNRFVVVLLDQSVYPP